MLEAAGLRNLIAEFGVASTRTSLYTGPERFADYVFVSPGVDVSAFRALPDEVSDHAPLMLEFGLKAAVRQLNRNRPPMMLRRKSGSVPPVGVVRVT